MTKNFFKLMAAYGVGAIVMSCASTKNASGDFSLQGHWEVVSINGIEGELLAESKPFIDFGANGRISGNAGCNRMMGNYVADTVKQTLSLDQMGSTRMMCRDMRTENALLTALGQVKAYHTENGQLVLVDEKGIPLVTLGKAKSDK